MPSLAGMVEEKPCVADSRQVSTPAVPKEHSAPRDADAHNILPSDLARLIRGFPRSLPPLITLSLAAAGVLWMQLDNMRARWTRRVHGLPCCWLHSHAHALAGHAACTLQARCGPAAARKRGGGSTRCCLLSSAAAAISSTVDAFHPCTM